MKMRLSILIGLISWGVTARAGMLSVLVADKEGKPIVDAVVMATPSQGQIETEKNRQTFQVDQIDKEFVHYVTVIPTGTPVQFPNSDKIRHHVYSFSSAKQFELPLYMGTPAKPVIFDKPGVVKLGCNIHDWMVGYINVTDAPFFKITDKNGKVQLINLASGKYNISVWHPRLGSSETEFNKAANLGDSESKTVTFQLTLKPELRPRRAPLSIQQHY